MTEKQIRIFLNHYFKTQRDMRLYKKGVEE